MLIGHGTYDDVEYKFNLPGPDMTGAELAALPEPHSRGASVDGQHDQRERRVRSTRSRKENRIVIAATKAGTEKNATVFRPLLGGGAARPYRRYRQERDGLRAEAFRYAEQKTANSTRPEAARHGASTARRHRQGGRRARAGPEEGQGRLAAAFTLLR